MNYHNILHDNMLNGDGLRVVLFVSGCSHRCTNCQNPQTWNTDSGILFDEYAKKELFEELNKDYISGITFSGGDPLHENNVDEILNLVNEIRYNFPNKTIWLYTGYKWSHIFNNLQHCASTVENKRQKIVELCDVLVDGLYVDSLQDINAHWVGSTNQNVINVQASLNENKIVLYN